MQTMHSNCLKECLGMKIEATLQKHLMKMVCSTCSQVGHVGCAVKHVLQLAELEQPRGSLDESLPHIGELLAWSRQVNNKKDGMGGLDQYLIQLLCCSKPCTLRAAMQRLETAHKSNVQVCFLLLI
jgi:hypothetical protein